MSDKSNFLNYDDDAFWDQCQQGGSITPQDLGIDNIYNSQGVATLTEGCTNLQFELNSQKNNNK